MSLTEAVADYWRRAADVLGSHDFQRSVAAAAEVLGRAYRSGGIVVTAGNGGSASTASHMAADLAKYATNDAADFRVVCLNDNVATLTAWTNDDSWSGCYERQVLTWLSDGGGVLVLFSVHGGGSSGERAVSDNLVRAAQSARAAGNRVVAFTGFDGGGIGQVADVHVNVPVDIEPTATALIESLHVLAHHAVVLALRTGTAVPGTPSARQVRA